MYSIGDLSQLGGVTPRVLRHYHDLGVLVPAEVDDATGYRRYHESQLAELLHVLALKDLGFSLTEIRRVVDGGVTPPELRGMLVLRRTELETELDEAATRLERVEAHIQRLENQMNNRPTCTVTVATKRLPAVHLAVASGVSPSFASADITATWRPSMSTRSLRSSTGCALTDSERPDTRESSTSNAPTTSPSGAPRCSSLSNRFPGASATDQPARSRVRVRWWGR